MKTPAEVKRLGTEGIRVTWEDGTVHQIPSRILRENCPSAETQAKRGDTSHEKPLSPKKSMLNIVEASSEEELRLERIWGIGNYAVGMQWGDGHHSGIYTFDLLYELGNSVVS